MLYSLSCLLSCWLYHSWIVLVSSVVCTDQDFSQTWHLWMQIQGKGTHRSNAGFKSWYLMGVGHLLCQLQLQAALVSWPENLASTNMQQPAHPSGPARGQGVTPSGHRCSPEQRFLAGEGRGTAGLSPGVWDRSLPAGKELEKPVVGSRRFLLPELFPLRFCGASASFSSLWSLWAWATTGQPLC